MARAVRYIPDFLAYRRGFPLAYWEVKVNSRQSSRTGNFAIERACQQGAEDCRNGKAKRTARVGHRALHRRHVRVAREDRVGPDEGERPHFTALRPARRPKLRKIRRTACIFGYERLQ